jgi:hypothetical protein
MQNLKETNSFTEKILEACSIYGYETFEEIMDLIKEKINDIELQV